MNSARWRNVTVSFYCKPTRIGCPTEFDGNCAELSKKLHRNSFGSQIVILIFMTLVIAPQFYVLTRPKSSRYCQQPLLNNLACFIILSFMAMGFAVVLTLIDPVPRGFRAAFHVFGVISFTQGVCTAVLTATAAQCAKTTPELFYLSYLLTWACVLTTVFFLVMGGFWIANALCPERVLDQCSQSGVCYEPVHCCSCLWHV